MPVNINFKRITEEYDDPQQRDVTRENIQGTQSQSIALIVLIVALTVVVLALLGGNRNPPPPPASSLRTPDATFDQKMQEEQHSSVPEPTGRFDYSFSIPANAHGFRDEEGVRLYSDGRVEPFSRRQSW